MVSFGVHISNEGASMSELRALWLLTEELGFDWLSAPDHFLPMLHDSEDGSFEGVALQSALAEATSRVRVGSLVYGAGYRNPMLMAAAASTIDHISGGRLELGMGAGWCEAEYLAFGIPFDSPGARLRRMRETVEIIRLLWAEDWVDYEGEFYQLRQAHVRTPVQALPRIWLGVTGEKVALKIAGEVADGWNCAGASPATFAHKRAILMEAAAKPGSIVTSAGVTVVFADRNVEDAVRQRLGPSAPRYPVASTTGGVTPAVALAGSVGVVTQMIGEYVEAGADWINLRATAPYPIDDLATFAQQVIPSFK
jgi:alkanesulfonate monooxygenase SsuD/methylene tetrahydromethanopterin reductase-like flavin-dependent oxidoreductase (luciferase family)